MALNLSGSLPLMIMEFLSNDDKVSQPQGHLRRVGNPRRAIQDNQIGEGRGEMQGPCGNARHSAPWPGGRVCCVVNSKKSVRPACLRTGGNPVLGRSRWVRRYPSQCRQRRAGCSRRWGFAYTGGPQCRRRYYGDSIARRSTGRYRRGSAISWIGRLDQ